MRVYFLIVVALFCSVQNAVSDDFVSADIATRGLLDTDFPRLSKLDTGVYTYEGLHSPLADGTTFNTVSLIIFAVN